MPCIACARVFDHLSKSPGLDVSACWSRRPAVARARGAIMGRRQRGETGDARDWVRAIKIGASAGARSGAAGQVPRRQSRRAVRVQPLAPPQPARRLRLPPPRPPPPYNPPAAHPLLLQAGPFLHASSLVGPSSRRPARSFFHSSRPFNAHTSPANARRLEVLRPPPAFARPRSPAQLSDRFPR